MPTSYITRINAELKSFRLPVYRKTKGCDFIEYYAFNPDTGKLGRKRIKVNQISGAKSRREYAQSLMKRLTDKLSSGWNPFIEAHNPSDLLLVKDCIKEFEQYNQRMYDEGTFRKQTFTAYKSHLKRIAEYTEDPASKITFLYQFDAKYCNALLDHFFIVLKYSGTTRNNYLTFLNVFFSYFVEHGHLQSNPAGNIKKIAKRMLKKEREIIPLDIVASIAEYLKNTDKIFLLACYLLYYCFVRPQELCRLRISNLRLSSHTIFISGEQAKNRKDEYITLNKKTEDYIKSLHLDMYPSDYYIFSRKMKPGRYEISPCRFSDRWRRLRNELGFSATYEFYSLKDTGITELADRNITNISIRDQARHSSLAITDVYTRHSAAKANDELREYDGSL